MRFISSGEKRPNWISLMVRKGALEKGKKTFDIVVVVAKARWDSDSAGREEPARTWQ